MKCTPWSISILKFRMVEKDTIVIPFSAETKQGREEIWNLIDEIRSDAEESGE